MKLSNNKILNDAKRLGEISQRQLPVKVSYAIAKNLSKIEAELNIYNKEKQKLIDQYGKRDENGQIEVDEAEHVIFPVENLVNWNKSIRELLDIENEVDIHKFSIKELEGFSMSPLELRVIDYMIEE